MKNFFNQTSRVYMPDELKFSNNTPVSAKKPRYIYTEEDLGEGILEVGVSA